MVDPSVEQHLEQLLDELYGSEATDFIATRNRIARDLRGEGRKDDAAIVAACRRPTAAADSINRVARAHADELKNLLDVGAQLRDAQVASVRDADARDDVRRLQRERRALLDQLAGYAPAHRDEVERGLAATLVDDEIAANVQRGRLERVPEPASGFDALGSALGDLPAGDITTGSPDGKAATRQSTRPQRDAARLERAIEDEDRARAEADDATKELERLRRALAAAERRVNEASRRLERATAKREKLEEPD